jgi:hypothetical protein
MKNKTQKKSSTIKMGLIGVTLLSSLLISCGGGSDTKEEVKSTETTATETAISEKHYTAADLVEFDLSSAGINVITLAPKGAKTIKYEVNGNITVYGGKFFKNTFSFLDGIVADQMSESKSMQSNKELNPSFDKFEQEDETGFLSKKTDGTLSFTRMVQVGTKTLFIQEGMPYDVSPDQFTEYSPEDIKIMYEAAKATKIK